MTSGSRSLTFRQKARIAIRAAFDRRTPLSVRGLLFGGLLYGVLPIDLIPDLIPLLGLTDDAGVILFVILTFLHLSKAIRQELGREERNS